MKIVIATIIISALFTGCLSEKTSISMDTSLDIKPQELTLKSGEAAAVMIRVTNNGKSNINPFVRFNLNNSDRQYINFSPDSYDIGILRPGEDSGFRIVDVKAYIAAGNEIKYSVTAEVVNNGSIRSSKDMVLTITR